MRVIRHMIVSVSVCLVGCALVSGGGVDESTQERSPMDTRYEPVPESTLTHPEWAENAVLYQINLRQFTEEGTLAAAQRQLPRLKALGVDILWLMPIHEIGMKHRKGSLGSPYAVRDYRSVNKEFGTFDDLRAFVDAAHGLGLRVILDWVANHTAWDHDWVSERPDWYERNWRGDFRPTPWWDWSDIINLDYGRADLRREMSEAMQFWVREAGIDGYRCDVAGMIPTDFWETVRADLEAIKPVFMLAEWEARDLHARAFDASYAWSWYEAMHGIAQGKAPLSALYVYYSWNESAYPRDAYRMTFVSNHDKNAWEATQFEAFGEALDAAIVLSVVGEGIPLIYNGQEAGNPKRLAFFERDPIAWREHPVGELYRQLFQIKKGNSALANGAAGGRMVHVPNSAPEAVLSFVRDNGRDRVFAALNLSGIARQVRFVDGPYRGAYTDAFTGEALALDEDSVMALPAWGWRVLEAR